MLHELLIKNKLISSLICAFIGDLRHAGLSSVLIVEVTLEVMNVRVCHFSLKCTTTFTPSGGEKVLYARLHQVKNNVGVFNPFPHPCSKNILLISETKNFRTL